MSSPNRAEMILALKDKRIHRSILECIAKRARSPLKGRRRIDIYSSLNEKALRTIYRAFVKYEADRAGRFLEYRLADIMMRLAYKGKRKQKILDLADIRKDLVGTSNAAHPIDVVGYDKEGNVVAIGESKSTQSVIKDHIAKWLAIVEDLGKKYEKLRIAIFLSTGNYKPGATLMIKDKVDKKGFFKIKTGRISSRAIFLLFVEEREGGETLEVWPQSL